MSLDIVADETALHNTGRALFNAITNPSQAYWTLEGLYTLPHYPLTASIYNPGPMIPSPELFNSLTDPSSKPTEDDGLPSVAECAVHLEFLEALHTLRHSIIECEALDDVLKIKPIFKFVDRKGVETKLKDETLWTRKQVKWEHYLHLAVARFLAWWEKVPSMSSGFGKVQITKETLPPLDVLMVWHSFLLNPRFFRNSCDGGSKTLYHIDFPWKYIHEALDQKDWSFSSNAEAAASFKASTGLEYSLLDCMLSWGPNPVATRLSIVEAIRFDLTDADLDTLSLREIPLISTLATAHQTTAIALKGAVLRQQSFVDKMHEKLWVRSPSPSGTITRALARYRNFVKLFKLYPKVMFVPTLDIDLAWHTHQCSPSGYYKTTLAMAGRFINHDDSVVQGTLDTGLHKTMELYRVRFSQEYMVCGCWDCQTLLTAVEKSEKSNGKEDLGAISKQVGKDVAYYRAVEVARTSGKPKPLPAR